MISSVVGLQPSRSCASRRSTGPCGWSGTRSKPRSGLSQAASRGLSRIVPGVLSCVGAACLHVPMADTQWIPRSKRGDATATAEFLEFVPELEGRQRHLVIDWLMHRGNINENAYFDQTCDLYMRFMDAYEPRWAGSHALEMPPGAWRRVFTAMEEEELLEFLDYALHDIHSGGTGGSSTAANIDEKLLNAHSIYGVGEYEGRYCVIERVDPSVQTAVKGTVEASGTAGQLLNRAWAKAYGRQEDAPGAYSNAIKAVETIACPLILPANPKATLGTAIKALDDQHNKSAKSTWEFAIENPSHAAESVNAIISMMKLLWHGQVDRHGSEASDFRDATIDEARAAVLLAATLVGWLNDRYLEKTE